MPYSSKLAIAFLKEIALEVEQILSDSEHVLFLVERLYKKYDEFVEANPDITRSEAFKNLEKDIRNLHQTSKFVASDCLDVKHSIEDCGVELN